MTEQSDWSKPQNVSGVDVVFGTGALDLMPPMADIPPEFGKDGNSWVQLQQQWFFRGLQGRFVAKSDIDLARAMRHLTSIQRSFEPKHEHKEAAVAYLMSLWFERFEPDTEAGA